MKPEFSMLIFFSTLLFINCPAHGQKQVQTDSLVIFVVDMKTGEPLSGVTVNYLYGSVGAMSNKKGLTVLPKYPNKKIVASFVGFDSDTVTLN